MRILTILILIMFCNFASAFTPIKLDGEFSLQSTIGNKFDNNSLKGKYSLVYFGFASCHETCPAALNIFGYINNNLHKKDNLQTIFVSVDYEKDDINSLKHHLEHFSTDIIGLSGSKKQVDEISKKFKVYYAKDEKQEINHSSVIYFLNPQGELFYVFGHSDNPEEVLSKIKSELGI